MPVSDIAVLKIYWMFWHAGFAPLVVWFMMSHVHVASVCKFFLFGDWHILSWRSQTMSVKSQTVLFLSAQENKFHCEAKNTNHPSRQEALVPPQRGQNQDLQSLPRRRTETQTENVLTVYYLKAVIAGGLRTQYTVRLFLERQFLLLHLWACFRSVTDTLSWCFNARSFSVQTLTSENENLVKGNENKIRNVIDFHSRKKAKQNIMIVDGVGDNIMNSKCCQCHIYAFCTFQYVPCLVFIRSLSNLGLVSNNSRYVFWVLRNTILQWVHIAYLWFLET